MKNLATAPAFIGSGQVRGTGPADASPPRVGRGRAIVGRAHPGSRLVAALPTGPLRGWRVRLRAGRRREGVRVSGTGVRRKWALFYKFFSC